MLKIVLILGFVLNLIAFITYGIDKRKAINHAWRIPEATLIWFAVPFTALGALLGMLVFHHKTQKPKFYITVPLLLLVQIGLIVFLLLKFSI